MKSKMPIIAIELLYKTPENLSLLCNDYSHNNSKCPIEIYKNRWICPVGEKCETITPKDWTIALEKEDNEEFIDEDYVKEILEYILKKLKKIYTTVYNSEIIFSNKFLEHYIIDDFDFYNDMDSGIQDIKYALKILNNK